jgi:hypothetical protein
VEKLNPDAASTSYLHALEIMVARGFRHIPIAKSRNMFGVGRVAVYGMLDIVVCTRQLTRYIALPAAATPTATPLASAAGTGTGAGAPVAASAGAAAGAASGGAAGPAGRHERAGSVADSLPDSVEGGDGAGSAASTTGDATAGGGHGAVPEAPLQLDAPNVMRVEPRLFTLLRSAHRKLQRDVQAHVSAANFDAVVDTCSSALAVTEQVLSSARAEFRASPGIASGVRAAAVLALAMRIHVAKALGAAQLSAAAADGGAFMHGGACAWAGVPRGEAIIYRICSRPFPLTLPSVCVAHLPRHWFSLLRRGAEPPEASAGAVHRAGGRMGAHGGHGFGA